MMRRDGTSAAHGPVVIYGDRTCSRDEITAHARRAAGGFRSAGLDAGDAVALLLRNDFTFFEASQAARLAGAYPVPINWHASPDEAAYILKDCGAKCLVAHTELLTAALRRVLPDGILLLWAATPVEIRDAFGLGRPEAPLEGGLSWEDWIARNEPLGQPADGAAKPVIYTSGTTGRPKGVRRYGKSGSSSTKALAVYGLDKEGPINVLINGPMYHSVPNAYGRLALASGATIVLQPRFDPEDLLALIARHHISHMHIVPAMFVRLLRLPDAVKTRYDLASLRHVVHGAAPCARDIKMAMIDWWGPVIHEYYGSTETGLLTLHDSEEARRKPGTVGRALPGIDLAILDPHGVPLPPDAIGEVYARSATLHAFTYVGRDDERAEMGRGDFVTAGDIGWMDADGYLYLCGRKRDAIPVHGMDVFPARIEAMLLGLPGVKDCAVFGIPDPSGGERICVCVEPVAVAEVDNGVLRREMEVVLGDMDVCIEIVADLPREESGKIFKQKLRAAYCAAQATG